MTRRDPLYGDLTIQEAVEVMLRRLKAGQSSTIVQIAKAQLSFRGLEGRTAKSSTASALKAVLKSPDFKEYELLFDSNGLIQGVWRKGSSDPVNDDLNWEGPDDLQLAVMENWDIDHGPR